MDNNQNQQNNNNKQPKNTQTIVIFLIVTLAALVVINLFSSMFKNSTRQEISYDQFITMVENGQDGIGDHHVQRGLILHREASHLPASAILIIPEWWMIRI